MTTSSNTACQDQAATSEALAEVWKHLSALEKTVEKLKFAEATIITLANGDFLNSADGHRPKVGNAALGAFYGASSVFESTHEHWPDLLGDLSGAVGSLAASLSAKAVPTGD
ncbi:hypothetical protein [Pelagibius sp. Alg239-R121]|uniref:hypothetical protein n=1 Tax=Pelagibius sp. Alg239-R121 TaxID=2993448 RepID=UPI0024A6D0D3|nr:hypothetical protein [Pelagibius sp. Alg239-R121]